ncbi:MAG: D-alanyl-D-alanine carboxypeptidase family protein [Acidimicrobiia bacterium]|nr:D-alanyl-D-alanine carboxypeptidase family protein [Acidimicrobiia bacterium]
MSNRLLVAVLAAATLVAVPGPAIASHVVLPVRVDDGITVAGPPDVSAASWLLYDESTDLVLASFAPNEERAMASTTKIMTGLLVLEQASLDDMVTVSSRAAAAGEKEIDLVAGEELTMDALFKALMIHSANDAAIAIAEHISGSVAAFVALMNQRAAELGLEGTRFANPHGLDAPDHYSTAADLLALTRVAMSHPEFATAVRARGLVFPPTPDGEARSGSATNLMLGEYPGTIGVKTGFTNRALLTFVASAERDGRRIYIVLLGSEGTRAHFSDAKALFDYAFGDLGFVWSLSSGTPYEARLSRPGTSPIITAAGNRALLHVAGQGLLIGDPPAKLEDPGFEPSEDPPQVVERKPTEGPQTPMEAFFHWFRDLMNDG